MQSPALLLPVRSSDQPEGLDDYRSRGGYQGLATAIKKGATWLRQEVETSGLRGRGGAADYRRVEDRCVALATAHRPITAVGSSLAQSIFMIFQSSRAQQRQHLPRRVGLTQ